MRTKLTLQPIIVFILALRNKILIVTLVLNSTFAFSQTCNANLKVSKNRSIRSATSAGTYYKMSISNDGINNDVYTLSFLDINNICTNSDGSSNTSNVVLNISFEDNNFSPINTIAVNSGETLNFLVHVTVPVGTTLNKWCCTQITASSNTCSNYKINTTLHTLVINSNDD